MTSRILSILLLCTYIPLYLSDGLALTVTMLGYCALPLLCIWFSELVAEATSGFIRESPPFFVWLFGWITLLMPLVLKLVILDEFSG